MRERTSSHHNSINSILHSPTGQIVEAISAYPTLSHDELVEEYTRINQKKTALLLLLSFNQELDKKQLGFLREIIVSIEEAKNKILLSNMGWVFSIANKYRLSGVPIEDLFQQGLFGLMTAIEKFDVERKLKFSTYATFWIEQAITRHIYVDEIIKVPFHAKDILRSLNKGKETFSNLPRNKQKSAINGQEALRIINLDEPVKSTGQLLEELIATEDKPQKLYTEETKEWLQSIFEQVLTPKEEMILKLFHGIDCVAPQTIATIAIRMKLDRKYVNKLKNIAHNKLRDHLQSIKVDMKEFFA